MSQLDLEAVVRSRLTLESRDYRLEIVQEPEEGRAIANKEKARGAKWPLDPPPVIELNLKDNDKHRSFLHSPFWFCTAELETASTTDPRDSDGGLIGTTVSSLHKIKHPDGHERGYFIFGDLNVKNPSTYRLRFSLFEMRQNQFGSCAEKLNMVISKQFIIHPWKAHMTIRESTQLSRTLCEAGVKLRIRKESTKRKTAYVDWSADKQMHHNLNFATGNMLPLPHTTMAPPSRPMHAQTRNGYNPAGESLANRLSLSNSALGIRAHLDNEQNANQYKRPDSYVENAPNWPMTNWTPESMPAPYQPATSMAGNDFRPDFSHFNNNGSQPRMQQMLPQSPYSAGSNNASQWDENQLRLNQAMFNNQTFDQVPRQLGNAANGINQFDPEQMQNHNVNGFSNPANTPYGQPGYNGYDYQAYRGFPMTTNGTDH